ncbi:MAG: hypothetical protein IK136_05585 [Oscillospiraceae bacterium]|nr:hypothetical protein [Oscillospiraceae bacterium]
MLPILFPVLALFLAVFVMHRSRVKPLRHPYFFSAGSLACGFAAVIAQLFVVKRRVLSGDYGGIEDTIDAVILISVALALVVLLLNVIALGLAFWQKDTR